MYVGVLQIKKGMAPDAGEILRKRTELKSKAVLAKWDAHMLGSPLLWVKAQSHRRLVYLPRMFILLKNLGKIS